LFNLITLDCSNCPNLTSIPYLPSLVRLSCDNCPNLTSIPILTNLIDLDCRSCPNLTSIPELKNLTRLYCDNCPILTKIPKNNFQEIYKFNCKWLEPDQKRINKLIKVQRKCKKYTQKRREVILSSLIDYLPREVILYCIL